MTLKDLSNKLYESKVLHDYKDGKIDYRKVHEFIVGLNEALTKPDVSECEKLALTCIEITTGLNYRSKRSKTYLEQAKRILKK